MNEIQLIANDKCWIEHTALTQLKQVGQLPNVLRAVGLPDLHAGKTPVGIALVSEAVIYPHIIGNDIGCGMGLFATPIAMKKYKQDKMVSRLNHIRMLADLPTVNPYEEASPIHDLGTIGSGNHFAEFQTVQQVFDETAFAGLGIDKKQLLLLIHSGSRSYGQQIYRDFLDYQGLEADSERGRAYLAAHDHALLWARRNRAVVAQKLIDWLGYGLPVQAILDCHHNYVEQLDGCYYHRKGAVSALNGAVIVPGSRGSLTYLLLPRQNTAHAAYSLSHGAGRKWPRSLCKPRIQNLYDRDTIRHNKYGGRTVCHDSDLLFQEAPEAYKNIEQVVAALLEHGLCSVIATLKPLLTYKG